MAREYDGSIRIDPKTDTEGISAGLTKVSASMKKLFLAIATPLLSSAVMKKRLVGIFALIAGAIKEHKGD